MKMSINKTGPLLQVLLILLAITPMVRGSSTIVTFTVDMTLQVNNGTFVPGTDTVAVRGTFNSFGTYNLTNNPTDPSHRNLFSGTVNDTSDPNGGQLEYKFWNSHPSAENGGWELTANGQNRSAVLPAQSGASLVLPKVFFSDREQVTFQVDMTAQLLHGMFIPGVDTVDVRGNFNGWNQGVNICTNNPNGANTNIYRSVVVVTDGIGATEQYKFTFYPNNTTNTIWENPVSSPTIGGNRYFIQPNLPATNLPVVFFSDDNNTNFWVIHAFSGSDGALPSSGLILSGNTLYGAAEQGGKSGVGTVFKVNTDGTGFTSFYNFSDGVYGAGPFGGLILSGNTLFGKTGFISGAGAVFKVNTDGTGFTYLSNFQPFPNAGLNLLGNSLYWTTWYGGSSNNGVLFRVNTDGSGYTNLYNFSSNSGEGVPFGSLILSGSILYGTALYGGGSGVGTMFKINTDGTGFTSFGIFADGNNGGVPYGGVTLSGNTFYGTTWGGSSGSGMVFKVNIDGTGFTSLYNFTGGGDGAFPNAGLILLGNTLYGSTWSGGNFGAGTVFKVNIDGTGFTSLYNFTGGGDGGNPYYGGLIFSGNTLYGTAEYGGSSGAGTVFGLRIPNMPPEIIFQPVDTTVVAGAPATFSVQADGSDPLIYQWQFNGTNLFDSGRIVGSHSNTLSIAAVLPSDAGAYQVTVTNAFGSTNSRLATLTVTNNLADLVATSLQWNTLIGGMDFSYSIQGGSLNTATTAKLFWANGTNIANIISSTPIFTQNIPAGFSGGSTNIHVPGAALAAVPNGVTDILLVVDPENLIAESNKSNNILSFSITVPRIISQPTNRVVFPTDPASFTVKASGSLPLNYLWRLNGSYLTDSARLSGSQTDTLVISDVFTSDAGFYDVIVTNSYGSVTSAPVSLSILGTSPRFSNVQITNNQLVITVSGTTGQGTIVLYNSTNLIDWVPIFTNPPTFNPIIITVPVDQGANKKFYFRTRTVADGVRG